MGIAVCDTIEVPSRFVRWAEALQTRLLNDWPWKAIDWIRPTVLKNPQATTMTPLSYCDDQGRVVGNGGVRHSLRR